MPASVFSRSTECHNQDKVSMGTIAARDCLRSLQLTEQVAAAALLAACQALELRLRAGEIREQTLSAGILAMRKSVFEHFEFLTEDRPLESTLRQFVDLIQSKQWALYPEPGTAAK
jgi:histidine ammonia-lyase